MNITLPQYNNTEIFIMLVAGRVVVNGLGGGIKQKYHWVDLKRFGPTGEHDAPRIDRVLEILDCGCRTAKVALVGCGTELKYIIATVNMKPGDSLITSGYIPRIPGMTFIHFYHDNVLELY